MKKTHTIKLKIQRETIRSLSNLDRVVGGAESDAGCPTHPSDATATHVETGCPLEPITHTYAAGDCG